MTVPTRYEFRVSGHLDDHWAAWLGGVGAVRNDDGTTTLVTRFDDGAAVHGVLRGLRDIGATLLSLRAVEASGPWPTGTASRGPRVRPLP